MTRPSLRSFTVGWLLLASGGIASCRSAPPPPSDQALRDSLDLSPTVAIHRISLGGRAGAEHVVPTRLEVAPGDVVQFLNVDRRVHTVAFEADRLSPQARSFLDETSQMESPPLLGGGTRFVVTFRGAPRGEYPFRSEGPGGSAAGRIVVR